MLMITFSSNQYLLVDELSYRFEAPQRGEVVVFRYPRDPRQFFIKRVIGLPGETIAIKKGTIYVNDQAIRENYLDEFRIGDATIDSVTLGPDQYWLMGDNRANSLDSRIFGPVDKKFIIGKVWFRGWPADKFSFFQAPQY
jgi:signal peptidase I